MLARHSDAERINKLVYSARPPSIKLSHTAAHETELWIFPPDYDQRIIRVLTDKYEKWSEIRDQR